eukprot:2274536-Alexandrium_andersonii.AAC.1
MQDDHSGCSLGTHRHGSARSQRITTCVCELRATCPRNCKCLDGLDSALYSLGPRAKAKAENEAAG